jgi:hypothetical protein
VPIIVASKEVINEVDEVWQLVRTSESDSNALSFIRIGCLDSLLLEETIPKGTGLRRAAPYREFSERQVFVWTESSVPMVSPPN